MYSYVQKGGSALRILFFAIVLFALIFTGFVLISTGKVSKNSAMFALSITAAGLYGIYVAYDRHKKLERLRAHSFEWYKQQNPALVKNGRVSCRCGCTKIMIQHLLNHTYLRKHYCSACGETLYYTREG